ncbi:hypothetical protein MLD38_037121 [Melastoma candidum]|uniref:Uncharacterized protein n=1 Tax=Melastoma candidum TaxID=119954 RepID=A0ACB9LLS4_9MYRT|nr:hypothetical protein MLD38_037121 [Melastoma candidum]
MQTHCFSRKREEARTKRSAEMKSHVVCVPVPVQSHIGGMLKLARLLHHKGCFVTFINTEYNHRRLLHSGGLASLEDLPGWRFFAIPDGLPPSEADATQDISALCDSIRDYIVNPLCDLLGKLTEEDGSKNGSEVPWISHIVADGFMNLATASAAEKFGLPLVHLFTIPGCATLACKHYGSFMEKRLAPSRGKSDKEKIDWSNGVIDWIPGMKSMRQCDMPNFFGATDSSDTFVKFVVDGMERSGKADATIIHTFEELEPAVLEALPSLIPNIYPIGPFHLLLEKIPEDESVLRHVRGNLWEENVECLEWLDTKDPGSVLYVNFGSIAFLTHDELTEFAIGIANSQHPFLWVLRPDLVKGETAILPSGFIDETYGRGFLSGWCPQETVLKHRSVGGFLTHCGWNSVLESLSAGVPMICCPNFGDQQTNARYVCAEWKAGLDVGGGDVKRDEVERLVRELLGGEKGKEVKRNAAEWRRLAEEATTGPAGSAVRNLDKLVEDVLSTRR